MAGGNVTMPFALTNELHHVLDVQIEPDDRVQRETIAPYKELNDRKSSSGAGLLAWRAAAPTTR
jgi:hypothetical protein